MKLVRRSNIAMNTKIQPIKIGLAQATGLVLYIGTFSVLAWNFGSYLEQIGVKPHPIIMMTIFLKAG